MTSRDGATEVIRTGKRVSSSSDVRFVNESEIIATVVQWHGGSSIRVTLLMI
jgi:hypothetical protein